MRRMLSSALAMWIYRVGWLDAFAVLVFVLPIIAGVGALFWWAAPRRFGEIHLSR